VHFFGRKSSDSGCLQLKYFEVADASHAKVLQDSIELAAKSVLNQVRKPEPGQ
jgi:hypothetical protein